MAKKRKLMKAAQEAYFCADEDCEGKLYLAHVYPEDCTKRIESGLCGDCRGPVKYIRDDGEGR